MLQQVVHGRAAVRRTKNRRPHEHSLRFERLEDRSLLTILPLGPMQGGTPNYYGPEPNWAYSPQPIVDPATGAITGGIQKFVDSLPGLYFANAIPPSMPPTWPPRTTTSGSTSRWRFADTTTYPGSDYYEIALVQYTEQMSSSLNPTTLRGYVQMETPVNASVSHHVALSYPDGTTPILDTAGAAGLRVESSPVPGTHDRGREGPAGAHQVHQLPAHGRGRRPVPAGGHDRAWARAWARTWSCP